jgi:hypothetical protein
VNKSNDHNYGEKFLKKKGAASNFTWTCLLQNGFVFSNQDEANLKIPIFSTFSHFLAVGLIIASPDLRCEAKLK